MADHWSVGPLATTPVGASWEVDPAQGQLPPSCEYVVLPPLIDRRESSKLVGPGRYRVGVPVTDMVSVLVW